MNTNLEVSALVTGWKNEQFLFEMS